MTRRPRPPGSTGGHPRRSRGVGATTVRGVTSALLATAVLPGCSGEAAPGSGDPASAAAGVLRTTATLGTVTGRLDPPRRARARDAVGRVVEQWFDAAYLDRGGAASGAFPGFTRAAAAQARDDRALMSNALLAPQVEAVTPRRGEVVVDLLATTGRAQAATARFALVMALSGDRDTVDRVSGRLYLTPGGTGWQVVGYDVQRGTQR